MLNIKQCQKLEGMLQQLVNQNQLAGFTMAIMTLDETYSSYGGYRQLVDQKVVNSLDTIYDMASLSKLLSTATCILKMMEEETIQLQTKISDYLEIAEKEITVQDCLTHTTGFDDNDIADYKTYSDQQFLQALKQMRSHDDLKGKVHYSDTNFIYLGWLVDKLKGSLADYAKKTIFTPLGMKHTTYCPDDRSLCAPTEVTAERGIICGEVHDGKGYRLHGTGGSSGVFSNLEDVEKFVYMMMDEQNSFLSKQSRALLKTPLADTPTGRRSIGWIISDPATCSMGSKYSQHTLYHTGFTGGSILIDLDRKISLIILCNRVHPTRNNSAILDLRKDLHNQLYRCLK